MIVLIILIVIILSLIAAVVWMAVWEDEPASPPLAKSAHMPEKFHDEPFKKPAPTPFQAATKSDLKDPKHIFKKPSEGDVSIAFNRPKPAHHKKKH